MSILNLEYNGGSGGRAPRNKRNVKVWIGIGLVGAVIGIGSTLASTITINNGNTTEFGQGVSSTIYCGGAKQTVQVTPISSFDNKVTNTTNTFYVSQVKVTGIPSACAGVDFAVSIFDNGVTPNPLPMTADMAVALDPTMPNSPNPNVAPVLTAGTANVWFPDNCPTPSNAAELCTSPNAGPQHATGALIWYDSSTGPTPMNATTTTDVAVVSDHTVADAGSFTLTLPYPWLIDATNVAKIVVETKPDTNGYTLWSNNQGTLS